MFGLGATELVIILVIILLIFGVGKLPQLGEGVGKMFSGFRKAVREGEEVKEEIVQEVRRVEVVEVESVNEEQSA
jgi:sec-independent protein translocase protein TatA